MAVLHEQLLSRVQVTTHVPLRVFLTMTASKLFDFLGRVLMAALFVAALPGKFSNFAETAGFIASKGIPESLASVLLAAAIVVLIAGSILLVFGSNTVLGASLLLLFLVPTTLIFHTVPIDGSFFTNLALIGALILAITRAWGNGVPSFTNIRLKG